MKRLISKTADVMAPDGSEVRLLAACARGSMAHFTLPPGSTSKAVRHRSVDELWFILSGQGCMWFAGPAATESFALSPGLSFHIPAGTSFQFRNDGNTALQAVAVTMPPWPGEDEAQFVSGAWPPQL